MKIVNCILGFVCLILLFTSLYFWKESKTVLQSEPIITEVVKIDTLKVITPEPYQVTNTIHIKDTLKLYFDTSSSVAVDIPLLSSFYKDSSFEATITGYRCSLDSVLVFPKTIERTITNTNFVYKTKQWSLGLSLGLS